MEKEISMEFEDTVNKSFETMLFFYLDKKKDEFLQIKSYESQADFLQQILDGETQQNKSLKIEKHFRNIILHAIRWRLNLPKAEDFDYYRIMNYVNKMESEDAKFYYLNQVKKNIRIHSIALNSNDIFDLQNDTLVLKTKNKALQDYIIFIREFFSFGERKLTTEEINNLLNDRLNNLKVLLKEIKQEIKFQKLKIENVNVQSHNKKSEKKSISMQDVTKIKIPDLIKKIRYVLRKDKMHNKRLMEKIKHDKEKIAFIITLLKAEYSDINDEQIEGSTSSIERYIKPGQLSKLN